MRACSPALRRRVAPREVVERRRHRRRELAERLGRGVGVEEREIVARDDVVAGHEAKPHELLAVAEVERLLGPELLTAQVERLPVTLHDRVERALGERGELGGFTLASQREPPLVANEAGSDQPSRRAGALVNRNLAHAAKVPGPPVVGYNGVMKLSKQPFIALAAIGWIDGSLQRVEAVGLLRAAKEAGLEGDDLAAVEKATKEKVTLDDSDLGGMSEWEQVLTYALAAWFAQLDGVVSTSEHTSLIALGDKLGLKDGLRKRAAAVANDIACLPDGGRPERYDFTKLAARLQERMPQVAKPAS